MVTQGDPACGLGGEPQQRNGVDGAAQYRGGTWTTHDGAASSGSKNVEPVRAVGAYASSVVCPEAQCLDTMVQMGFPASEAAEGLMKRGWQLPPLAVAAAAAHAERVGAVGAYASSVVCLEAQCLDTLVRKGSSASEAAEVLMETGWQLLPPAVAAAAARACAAAAAPPLADTCSAVESGSLCGSKT